MKLHLKNDSFFKIYKTRKKVWDFKFLNILSITKQDDFFDIRFEPIFKKSKIGQIKHIRFLFIECFYFKPTKIYIVSLFGLEIRIKFKK